MASNGWVGSFGYTRRPITPPDLKNRFLSANGWRNTRDCHCSPFSTCFTRTCCNNGFMRIQKFRQTSCCCMKCQSANRLSVRRRQTKAQSIATRTGRDNFGAAAFPVLPVLKAAYLTNASAAFAARIHSPAALMVYSSSNHRNPKSSMHSGKSGLMMM